jgi:8-oxo-dGTP pyrophosphatase MutT (NUDIX family)
MSAGVILVDREGRVLMQLRDDDPAIMFPGHWGLTGGAAQQGETPEQTARREVEEETGIALERCEPFRAYYFTETSGRGSRAKADYELYLFHAPCVLPVEDMVCGEGRELRFFAPQDIDDLDIAYNHREVLADFFTSATYALYLQGDAFENTPHPDPVAHFQNEVDAGTPWFDALMESIALWQRPDERVGEREYRYLIGGEAFDWLLLAERLIEHGPRLGDDETCGLLFEGVPPGDDVKPLNDERLRDLIGDAKHRAHLNYVYGVTVEEALQYAYELDLAKELRSVAIRDPRDADVAVDPVYERIYGKDRYELLRDFRDETLRPHEAAVTLSELREFMYWLFKYRVKNAEPARVASDTRKALAQLSSMEEAVRRRRGRLASERQGAHV